MKSAHELFRSRTRLITLILLVGAACLLMQSLRPEHAARTTTAKSLQGASAVEQLKKDGSYSSLAAAMNAARYQVRPGLQAGANRAWEAPNPTQNWQASFTSAEMRIVAQCGVCGGRPEAAPKSAGEIGWEVGMKLTGFGHGETPGPVSEGEVTVSGERVEIRKSAIRNPQSAITEWYVNKPEGLEQGFTLAAPPAGAGNGDRLRLTLRVTGDLRAEAAGGQSLILRDQRGQTLLTYDHLAAWDAGRKSLPATMKLNGDEVTLEVDDAGARYPLTIDPLISQQQKLTAADGAAQDGLGTAVAFKNNLALVGAAGDDADRGSAYVFARNGNSWTQAKLTASDGVAGDSFGWSVALDGNTAVIGAPMDDAERGAVYVFGYAGGTWTQQQKLTGNGTMAGDRLGWSVAVSGNTLVAGAYQNDAGGQNAGAAFVFFRNGAGWSQQAQLYDVGFSQAGDHFGQAVAISGETLAVTANDDDNHNLVDAGEVIVFTRSGVTWTLTQRLTAADGAANDRLGASVALGGDTLIVGAPNDDIGNKQDQGSAYVFQRLNGTWTQQQKLTAGDGAANDYFGGSVGLDGDLAVVGAEGDDIGANGDQGSAYVFARSTLGEWSLQQKLTAADGATGDQFGQAVAFDNNMVLSGAWLSGATDRGAAYAYAVYGDLTQQQLIIHMSPAEEDDFGWSLAVSGNTAVVGAPRLQNYRGAAFVFTRNNNVWLQTKTLMEANGEPGEHFGESVAIDGDRIVVGQPEDVFGDIRRGSVYVYVRNGGDWGLEANFTANDARGDDNFGYSVAISGDTILAGNQVFDLNATPRPGAAYVFTRNPIVGIWTQQQKLTPSDGGIDDLFGERVALDGDTAVIGARRHASDRGAAYVFVRSGSTWSQQKKLMANDAAPQDQFGYSVAVSGDTVLVGAWQAGGLARGAAYVYTRSGANWTQQQKLMASDGSQTDNFGFAVTIKGDLAVVGAPSADGIGNDFNSLDVGAVYLFRRDAGVWRQKSLMRASDNISEVMGWSVGLTGETVLAGAWATNLGGVEEAGAVFYFTPKECPQLSLSALPNGAFDSEYSQSVTVNGGAGPYQFVLAEGTLPPGLFLYEWGELAGVPGVPGTYSFTVQAMAENLCTVQRKYTLTITGCPGITLNPVALPGGTVGQPYNQTLTPVGGTAPYIFAFAGNLPNGIGYNQQTGELFGTPTAAGSFSFTARATDFNGCQGIRAYTVTINCPTVTVNPATLPGATVHTPFNAQLSAAGGGAGAYSYSVSSGALPNGLTLNPNLGTLSGTPKEPGTSTFTIKATSANGCTGTRTYTLTVACAPITLAPASLPNATAGTPYNQTITANGGAGPYTFTVSAGALPQGLTLAAGGALSGAPTAFGNFNFTIKATDANGCSGTRVYALAINPPCTGIAVNPTSLPDGTTGTAYTQTVTATSGAAPYTFTVSAGDLPTGLSLAANGALAGTPNAAGNFNFTVKATDANGCFGTRAYTVTINGTVVNNGLQFYPLPKPLRLLDTRAGFAGCDAPGTQIPGGTSRTQLARRTCDGITIPANALAVTGNITTVQSGGGYLTLYPSDVAQPLVTNSNYAANEIINNVFTVGLGNADGSFKIFVTSNTHVVVDVTGYYAPPAAGGLYFHPLPKPIRLLETRAGFNGAFTPGVKLQANTDTPQQARVTYDGVTIPNTALAIVGNATTVNNGAGYLTLYPGGVPRPLATNSTFSAGQVMNAPFTVRLSATGEFMIFTSATTDLVIDVLGYYSVDASDANGAGLLFNPLTSPVRLLETRAGFTGCYTTNAPLLAGSTRQQQGRGVCGGQTITANASAVVGNATVINDQVGYLTFSPDGAAQPLVATSNFASGQILNRHFTVGLGATGVFNIFASSQTDLIIDVSGFFAP